MQPLARIPEVVLHPARASREFSGRVRLPPFQNANSQAGLAEPVRHHRAAESGSDYYRVEVFAIHAANPLTVSQPLNQQVQGTLYLPSC